MKSPAELAARLARQWQLADNREIRLLSSEGWPLTLSIGKPTPAELTQKTEQVRLHLQRWRAVTIGEVVFEATNFRGGAEPVRVPTTWRLRSTDEWVAATADPEVQREYGYIQTIRGETDAMFHRVLVRQRPFLAGTTEEEVIRAARVAMQLSPGCARGRPLRALSLSGIDSKFLERNRGLLIQLLDARFEGQISELGLERFLGAVEDSDHWLLVVPLAPGLLPFGRLKVRARDLSATALPGSHLLVVENERCVYQLPPLLGTVAVLGAGLNLEWMESAWIGDKRVGYWGDLDTWGLLMLSRARERQPHVEPILMSREVFESMAAVAVRERQPAGDQVPRALTNGERVLYQQLLAREHGRVEQEFLPRDLVWSALQHWRG